MALFRCASGSSGGGATITVTYSSDFYGETITCTNGVKTYSKVATSSGTVEFAIDEEGTWTISSMGFSDTVEVVLSYPAQLEAIPDGETVLPTDDVATWLLCAGITDITYTTLADVLDDSVTFNALLGDSNACAYMARSTTWSTDICADQYAMNLLGQYDTACDALLSDSTWASAIANSTYFESVLDVSVPKMTSATAPSGEVSASSTHSSTYPAYKAFNSDEAYGWIPAASGTLGNTYIQYDFGEAKVISEIMQEHVSDTAGDLYTEFVTKLQGSNDGTTFTDIKTDISTPNTNTPYFINVENTVPYRYYRIVIMSLTPSSMTVGRGLKLQFYGRTTSSEKIHGGNPTYDSFYRIVDGNNVPVTDPSLLDAGTYTIYSNGLAKDPDNLSNDYGKTVRICPNTKEIVVRPDNSLYWYGYQSGACDVISTSNGWAQKTTNTSINVVAGTLDNVSYSANPGGSEYRGLGGKYLFDFTDISSIQLLSNAPSDPFTILAIVSTKTAAGGQSGSVTGALISNLNNSDTGDKVQTLDLSSFSQSGYLSAGTQNSRTLSIKFLILNQVR